MSFPFSPAQVERWAAGVALALLVLVIALLLLLLALRLYRRWREPRRQAMLAEFRRVLMQVALGDLQPAALAGLDQTSRWELLKLWLHAQLSLSGAAQGRLRQLGLACQLEQSAWIHVHGTHHAQRMMAMLALGFLGHTSALTVLRQRLLQGHALTPIYAARAMLDIDGAQHAREVIQVLLEKPALDLSLVSVLLKPHRGVLQEVMLHAKPPPPNQPESPQDSDSSAWVRWLRLARALQLQLPSHWLTPLLHEGQELESLIAAIRLYQGECGIAPLLALTRHPDWRVRSQVARALAYVGDARCADELIRLTTDREWWVRFRSAQALFQLPGVSAAFIVERVAQTGDRYAIQMVHAVQVAQGQHHG
jgi:hypothetical protein